MTEKPETETSTAPVSPSATKGPSSGTGKKKKTKGSRNTASSSSSSRTASGGGLSSSARSATGGDHAAGTATSSRPRRRRSRSTDKLSSSTKGATTTRRDSGSNRPSAKERTSSSSSNNNKTSNNKKKGDRGGGGASSGEAVSPTVWERKGRKTTKDGNLRGSAGSSSGGPNHSPQRSTRRAKSESNSTSGGQRKGQRNRSKSPSRAMTPPAPPAPPAPPQTASASALSTTGSSAPRLPQRTISDSSRQQHDQGQIISSSTTSAGEGSSGDLQLALEATRKKTKQPMTKKDSFEEASLGDFQMYAQQKRIGGAGGGSSLLKTLSQQNKSSSIPEESLGSFAAFAKKYEEEKLLGLHDADEGPDVYGQRSSTILAKAKAKEQQQQTTNDVSMSLGNLMGGGMGNQQTTNNNNHNHANDVSMSLGNIVSGGDALLGGGGHDGDDSNNVSMSLGNIMNPMNQYGGVGGGGRGRGGALLGGGLGGGNNNRTRSSPEDSLGSFGAFHHQGKYQQNKLLGGGGGGLYDSSAMSDLSDPSITFPLPGGVREAPVRTDTAIENKSNNNVPNESNGEVVQQTAQKKKEGGVGDGGGQESADDSAGAAATNSTGSNSKMTNDINKKQDSGKGEEESKWKDSSFYEFVLPKHRIEKLGKRGGVGYKIMVDTPGGHAPVPMKIVVAIEFDDTDDENDDTDSDDSEDEGEEDQPELDEVPAIKANEEEDKEVTTEKEQANQKADQAEEINESGHLPLSALDDDRVGQDKAPGKPLQIKKKHAGKQQKPQTEEDEEEDEEHDHSEIHDEVGPLAGSSNRWNNQSGRAGSPKQPEREKTTSSHSTISSVTLESVLGGGVELPIHNDASPSHKSPLQRKPGGVARGKGLNAPLRRSPGGIPAGGTATRLKRPSVVTPHNLGTKRGLLLRQQSEASMMSTGTSKSNDSSWAGTNNDMPMGSFMQLNLVNLDKTEMQTNETVERAELPDALRSGVEGIEDVNVAEQVEVPQPQGSDLESIPEGKDPMAAASELLGMKTMLKHIKRAAPKRSKSFEFDRDMPKQMWNMMFAKAQKGELPGSQFVDNDESFIDHEEEAKLESTRSAPPETSSPKPPGPASFWNSTVGLFMPSTKKSKPDEPVSEETTEKANLDASEGSLELDGILKELDQSLAHHVDGSGFADEEPTLEGRRDESERGMDASAKGMSRSGRRTKGGGIARSRAARAQQAHNRSLRDTVDYYTAEQEDDDLPQLDAINEDEAKKRRVRARRKTPNRTKSDDGTGGRVGRGRTRMDGSSRIAYRARSRSGEPRDPTKKLHNSFSGVDPSDAPPTPNRTKSDDGNGIRAGRSKMDGSSRILHRTRSQEGVSPIRPSRDATRKMHSSFSGIDPSDAPAPLRRARTRGEAAAVASGDDSPPPLRKQGISKSQQESGDAHPIRRQGTKSREGGSGSGKDVHPPHRTRSHDKGVMRGSAGKKQRPQRKKSGIQVSDDHEATLNKRGADLPKDATEEEIKAILDYH